MTVPLRVCVGASNALPEDDALAAFADRFLLRAFVDAGPDAQLEELLEGGWALQRRRRRWRVSVAHLDAPRRGRAAPPTSPRCGRGSPRRCASSAARASSSPTGAW